MSDEPVFVVGVPRSGTTLLAAMLAAHSRLSCGPETHFFRWLARVEERQLCDASTWPGPAASFVQSIRHTAFIPGTERTLLEKYQIDESGIPAYLRAQDPSVPNILRSVTEQHMEAQGKRRWVEKTPEHLLHVATIRRFFPRSPIVRVIRDPRDVALSLMKVPWGVQSFLQGLLYWQRLDAASRDFLADDRLVYTLRFEDLVSCPREELQKLCRFVGEAFEERMLDTSNTGEAINSRNVPWKNKVREAPDSSRAEAWRSELTRPENQLAEALLGDHLVTLGYRVNEHFSRAAEIYPRSGLAAEYAGAMAIVASKGVRFWKAGPEEQCRTKVYLGEPGSREWLGEQKAGRVMKALPVLSDIASAAMRHRDLYWIPNRDDGQWAGYVSLLLRRCLSPYRVVLDSRGSSAS
jgi:hypothetical protein